MPAERQGRGQVDPCESPRYRSQPPASGAPPEPSREVTMQPIACRSAIQGFATALAATLLAWPAIAPAQQAESLRYPPTRTVDTVADFHGTRIADPYRCLASIDSADAIALAKAHHAR